MRKLSSILASAILLLGGAPALADGFSPQPLGATLGAGVLTALGVAKNTSGGVVLLNGSPTSGDLLQWSASGAQDSGVALSNVPLLNAANSFSAGQVITVSSGRGLDVVSSTGSGTDTIRAVYPSSAGGGAEIMTTNGYSAATPIYGFWYNNSTGIGNPSINVGTLIANGAVIAKWSSAGLQATNLLLPGSSTGVDTISSGNVSTTSRTISTPAGTANDTLALLGAGQTFSAANTFSGAVTHSGSALFSGAGAALSANGQTTVLGGATAPTPGATYTGLFAGGSYSIGGLVLGQNGQGAIYTNAAAGLVLQGKSSSSVSDVTIVNGAGNLYLADFSSSYGAQFQKLSNMASNHLISSSTAPTLGTGGGTIGANQNGTYYVSFTASSGGGAQVVNLPTANADWTCELHDRTSAATIVVVQTNATASASSATFTPYSRTTGLVTTWPGADLVTGTCWGG